MKQLLFDRIKILKVTETATHKWMLEGSYRKFKKTALISIEKRIISSKSFEYIDEFTSLDKCKIFCDLNLPSIPLKIITFKAWYHWYYLL